MDAARPGLPPTCGPTPEVTVVIPTHARPARLAECLGALAAQEFPADRFEVVIVDDGSPMSLAPAVAAFADRLHVTLVRQANAGPARARNAGVAQARGRFLAFTDDDCVPEPGWLGALAAALRQTPEVVVGGPVGNRLAHNLYSEASQTLVTALYRYYNRDPEQCRFFTSNNLAVGREAFGRVGGFDSRYCLAAAEDRELCDRWLQRGGRMRFVPGAVVWHAHELSPGAFLRQHYHYGQGAYQYRQARAARDAGRVRLEPVAFYAGLLAAPWATGAARPASLAALQVVAQVANAAGYFRRKLRGPADAPPPVELPAPIAAGPPRV